MHKLEAAIDLLKTQDPEKAEIYREKLEAISAETNQTTPPLESISTEDSQNVDPGFLLDYLRLISDPQYLQGRQEQWRAYLPS
jgi:hypothetical protein